MSRVRFQADCDLDGRVLNGLRREAPHLDIVSAHEAGFEGLPDPDVLAHSAREERILISRDRSTMPGHFVRFIRDQDHPGVILLRQEAPIGQVIQDLLLIWAVCDPREFTNQIRWVPLQPAVTG